MTLGFPKPLGFDVKGGGYWDPLCLELYGFPRGYSNAGKCDVAQLSVLAHMVILIVSPTLSDPSSS